MFCASTDLNSVGNSPAPIQKGHPCCRNYHATDDGKCGNLF